MFLLVSVLIGSSFGLRISPEVPLDLSISLCSHQEKLKTHGNMQYFPQPAAYCGSIRSSKHRRHQLHDEKQSTSLASSVSLTWRNVASNVHCKVEYKGYQAEYRFSPDFGTYSSCQTALNRHIFNLPESTWLVDTPPARLNESQTNPDCPLTALPATYGDYVSCALASNAWYILDWHSAIQYETFFNGSYGTYWANHSTSFVFQPTDRMTLNGTEGEWLRRLLTVETRAFGCEEATALILVEKHWLPLSSVTVAYRIRHGQQKVFSQLVLASETIDRWLQMEIPLASQAGDHEICVHLTSTVVPTLRHKLCKSILDQSDCPFSHSRSPSICWSILILLLVLSG